MKIRFLPFSIFAAVLFLILLPHPFSVNAAGAWVGEITPTEVAPDVTTLLTATYNQFEAEGVGSCEFMSRAPWVVEFSTGYTTPRMSVSGGASSQDGIVSGGVSLVEGETYVVKFRCGVIGTTNYAESSETTITVRAASDATAPIVSAPSPASATVSTPVTITSTYADAGIGLNYCVLVENGVAQSSVMVASGTPASGSVSGSRTYYSAGSVEVRTRCWDRDGNVTTSAPTTLTVASASPPPPPPADTSAPVVGTIEQTTAQVGVSLLLKATVQDNVGVVSCDPVVESGTSGSVTISGGYASFTHTFSVAGTYVAYLKCRDAADNIGIGAVRSITVTSATPSPAPIDANPPTVGVISPISATVSVPVTFTAPHRTRMMWESNPAICT